MKIKSFRAVGMGKDEEAISNWVETFLSNKSFVNQEDFAYQQFSIIVQASHALQLDAIPTHGSFVVEWLEEEKDHHLTHKQLKKICESFQDRDHIRGRAIRPDFDEWWDILNKVDEKVIDLSGLIDSGIDCEFSKDGTSWHIGNLVSIRPNATFSNYKFEDSRENEFWAKCQPRMKHKMSWNGQVALKGFIAQIYLDDGVDMCIFTSKNNIDWPNVIAIEFLEVEDGYVHGW